MFRICLYCREEIVPSEARRLGVLHKVCLLRMVVGPVAHQVQRCPCYVPGSKEGDPEDFTRRDAAIAGST
jgi:hypothetical protein